MITDNLVTGKKIVKVRTMTKKELETEGWHSRYPIIVLELDNGLKIYASKDDEGNGPGALFLSNDKGETFQIAVQ